LYLQARKLPRLNREATARAIELLEQAVDIDPRFSAAMAEIGFRLLVMPDPRDTAESFRWAQRAIDTDPELADGYTALAAAHAKRGMMSKSRAEYLKAIELDPNRLESMERLAVNLVDLGQFEESLHWSRLALERNPNSPAAFLVVAAPLSALQDLASLNKWLQIGQVRAPNALRLPQARALAAFMEPNPAKALAMAREFHAAHPKNFEGQATLADMALAADAPDAEGITRDFYQDRVELSFSQWIVLPESARLRLAYFARRRGDEAGTRRLVDDAEKAARQAWNEGVDTPTLPIEMAVIRALRKDNDGAMEWIQRAYDRGWRIRASNMADPMLAELRSDARFQALMRRIQSDLDRMRKDSSEIRQLFEKTIPSLPPPQK
jgi:tetratricopeptide (TPR) repeat protein